MCFGVFVQVNEDSQSAKGRPIGYVIQENGCWEWVGHRNNKGYGVWGVFKHPYLAHRRMYERVRGTIPEGLQLDHLCRNKPCVNPDHLEAVTARENTLRGNSMAARWARRTHCERGHQFTPENVYRNTGARKCKVCHRGKVRLYKKLRREARKANATRPSTPR